MDGILWHNQIKCLNYSLNRWIGGGEIQLDWALELNWTKGKESESGEACVPCASQNCHSIDSKHQMCAHSILYSFLFAHKYNCQLSNAITSTELLRLAIKTTKQTVRKGKQACCHRRFIYGLHIKRPNFSHKNYSSLIARTRRKIGARAHFRFLIFVHGILQAHNRRHNSSK